MIELMTKRDEVPPVNATDQPCAGGIGHCDQDFPSEGEHEVDFLSLEADRRRQPDAGLSSTRRLKDRRPAPLVQPVNAVRRSRRTAAPPTAQATIGSSRQASAPTVDPIATPIAAPMMTPFHRRSPSRAIFSPGS